MIDENSMKESNTPNMGNRIVNFYKEKPKIATIIASATALLMCALAWSIDGFLSSDDDESKRPSTEEVDYTGYRDISTGVRTPSDYRRGGDNEESITKRIESAPNDRQTTTDESMKEIEEILTAEEVLYTVKEGDTRSSILMENVWLSSLKNEDFAKKAVFSTLAKNPQIKLIKQVKKGTSTASFPNLQSKLNPGDIIKIRMPATRDSIRKIVETRKLLLWNPVTEKDIEKFNYAYKINNTGPIGFLVNDLLGRKGIQYRPKQDSITDRNIGVYEHILRNFCVVKVNGQYYHPSDKLSIYDDDKWAQLRKKGATIYINKKGLIAYLKDKNSAARKVFSHDPVRYTVPRNYTEEQDKISVSVNGRLIQTPPYLRSSTTLCGRITSEQAKILLDITLPADDAVKLINYDYRHIPQYKWNIDGRTSKKRHLTYDEFLKAVDNFRKKGEKINGIQIFVYNHVATGYLDVDETIGWRIEDPFTGKDPCKKGHKQPCDCPTKYHNIPLKKFFSIYEGVGRPVLKVNFFVSKNEVRTNGLDRK